MRESNDATGWPALHFSTSSFSSRAARHFILLVVDRRPGPAHSALSIRPCIHVGSSKSIVRRLPASLMQATRVFAFYACIVCYRIGLRVKSSEFGLYVSPHPWVCVSRPQYDKSWFGTRDKKFLYENNKYANLSGIGILLFWRKSRSDFLALGQLPHGLDDNKSIVRSS